MALVKSVEIDIGVKGDTASKAKLDAINARAEELKKAFPEYTLKIDSAAASERLAVFRGQVKATADAASKPIDTVILTDKAKAKLLEVQAKADELKARFPEFTLRIDDTAAKRKLAVFAAEAKATTDIVDAELASAGGGGGRGGILGLLSGGGNGGNGGSSGAAAGGSLLTNPITLTLGALLGGGLIPGAAGLGIGGAVGGGAIAGGLFGAAQGTKILKADTANITQITTGLKTAIGVQKTQLSAALVAANKQFAKDSAFFAPFTEFQKSLSDLTQVIIKPLRSVMAPLSQIFTQFGKGLTLLGPQLTAMFKASLPFIQMFATVMLQMGKTLIPAFTQVMTEMVKSGALQEMTQALVILTQGVANFIVALGPGMKASATLFVQIATGIKGVLTGLGVTFSWIANVMEFVPSGAAMRLRHGLFATFNGIRHDIAGIWDLIFSNTLGRLQRGVADDQRVMANFRHAVANTFDGIRHDIAAAWDTIWNNTVSRVQNGISDVIRLFKGLPGRAVAALFGLGHSLASFASAAIGQMWTGFKNTFSAVIHWFEGLPKSILRALGVASPPGWAISAGKWIMKGLHIGLGHGLGQLTSFTTQIGKQVAAGLSGAGIGLGGVSNSSGYAALKSAAAKAGWTGAQWQDLVNVEMREAGFNLRAQNPGSGAYGMAQFINGPSEYYQWGGNPNTAAGQAVAMVNYIKSRYVTPSAAWAHELSAGWYDKGGWLMPGLTLAMNKTGKPERILPPGHTGAAQTVVVQFRAAHGDRYGQFLLNEIQKLVQNNGGGDVQATFGQKA